MRLIPDGEKVRLCEMDPGLFLFDNCLALKTEYMSNSGRIEAYIVDTGEFFHGGAKTVTEQRSLMVQPLKIVDLVLCKDCVDRYSSEYCECRPADGFCNDGERKDNG